MTGEALLAHRLPRERRLPSRQRPPAPLARALLLAGGVATLLGELLLPWLTVGPGERLTLHAYDLPPAGQIAGALAVVILAHTLALAARNTRPGLDRAAGWLTATLAAWHTLPLVAPTLLTTSLEAPAWGTRPAGPLPTHLTTGWYVASVGLALVTAGLAVSRRASAHHPPPNTPSRQRARSRETVAASLVAGLVVQVGLLATAVRVNGPPPDHPAAILAPPEPQGPTTPSTSPTTVRTQTAAPAGAPTTPASTLHRTVTPAPARASATPASTHPTTPSQTSTPATPRTLARVPAATSAPRVAAGERHPHGTRARAHARTRTRGRRAKTPAKTRDQTNPDKRWRTRGLPALLGDDAAGASTTGASAVATVLEHHAAKRPSAVTALEAAASGTAPDHAVASTSPGAAPAPTAAPHRASKPLPVCGAALQARLRHALAQAAYTCSVPTLGDAPSARGTEGTSRLWARWTLGADGLPTGDPALPRTPGLDAETRRCVERALGIARWDAYDAPATPCRLEVSVRVPQRPAAQVGDNRRLQSASGRS